MSFREKKQFEYDPKTLSLELLSTLQGALIAKLMLVNGELQSRYRNLADLSEELPGAEANRALFTTSANELQGFNLILDQILAKGLGKAPAKP